MPSDAPDLTPARLKQLLATVSLPLDNRGRTSREKSEATETLVALYATLSARLIELEGERDALRLAGKHLAIKLADFYRMGKVSPSKCQAMREWMALMPARAALETPNAD